MKALLVVFLILTVPCLCIAQTLKGKVVTQQQTPLQGATVSWLGKGKGTITNEAGEFFIRLPKKMPHALVISFVGHTPDTLLVHDTSYTTVQLADNVALAGITVQGSKKGVYIANTAVKTEVISSIELKKAACCDLAGCFETQASVQPQTTNIITNSKELRILGLSGIYNQVLIDGFPQIQALTYTYGISSIPGPLVENIFVAKGANSVLQGYESISGQINVLTREPDKAHKLLLNGYINSFGEKHLNVLLAFKKNKWSNLTAFHMVQPANRIDRDDDDFLDLPLLTRYMISNRWKKGDEAKWGWSTQLGVRYVSERRVGGQQQFDYKKDKGTLNAYGQAVNISQPEAWFKMAYRMNEQHRFAFYGSGFHQNQQSYFGVTSYNANQTNGYANAQYEFSYNTKNVVKAGVSFRHLSLSEKISFAENSLKRTYAGNYGKVENIAGIFAENTWSLLKDYDKLMLITGVRADHHNRFGWQVTPRSLLKFAPNDNLVFRASIGKGWRTANIFSENIGLLASSRDIIFAEQLQPEKAVNFGFNATKKYKSANVEGYVSLDLYRTSFTNQIFPDYDADPVKAYIRNFIGRSASNGFQLEASATLFNRFSAKAGYVYLDVYQIKNGIKDVLPFNPRHRVNGSASFMPLSRKWHADVNMHWYGRQRLPSTANNPAAYRMPAQTDAYTVANAQFTYIFKNFEVYGGIENVFDFRQKRPIISWQDPFGPYFDTQFAWGPTRGREMYAGVRYIIK